MAQRDKKEEPMELHAPEITLCANSCGFPGNPATKNLCQNCFLAASASASASPPSPSSSSKTATYLVVDETGPVAEVKAAVFMEAEKPTAAATAVGVEVRTARSANRCRSCRKRVGLTGFRCRCGELFCGAHRYTDRHECNYDYKAAARDSIARENPVVRAAKIVRF